RTNHSREAPRRKWKNIGQIFDRLPLKTGFMRKRPTTNTQKAHEFRFVGFFVSGRFQVAYPS
ncbi:MAG: hypothetical protein K2X55_13150, partial [Burkholderiaceae bacterium]|nr:hypothetical protein [Burkholderiaceae bacterium]